MGLSLFTSLFTQAASSDLLHVFAKFPPEGLAQTPCFPTPNTNLIDGKAEGFAARTRTNDQYGLPGWTRGDGKRFHKGVDISPLSYEKTRQTVRIEYRDPRTGKSFVKKETVLIPKDKIFSILDGKVVVVNSDENRSGYGRYVMIEHQFADKSPFISMYAHLDRITVQSGQVISRGHHVGWMGRTSSNSGGRSYLKAIPHCHFEVGRVIDPHFSKTLKAKRLYPKMLGGSYDPRNIQPYHPVDFLRKFHPEVLGRSEVQVHPELRNLGTK
jgi:murein DD-endopeptidase MepM/ murein hydrolase activator NlpD